MIKIVHMSAVALACVVFVLRALTLFMGVQGQQPNLKGRTAFVALQHLSYTLIVLTGMSLLVMNQFVVKPWFYAKIILFLVLISSLIKAYKKEDSILLAQRRAGLVISAVALLAILGLVMVKPVFN